MADHKRARKIAFVGGMGTGKTTLLEACRQRYPSLSFVEDAGRVLLTSEPNLNRTATDTHLRIKELQYAMEKQAHESGAQVIICDGSVITAITHIYAYGDQEEAKKQLEDIQFWLPSYEKFILLDPKDVPYKNDSVRIEHEAFRDKLHTGFIDIFTEANIPFEIIGGTVLERLNLMDEILQQKIDIP